MTFLTSVLAIYAGVMLSAASVVGFVIFFRNLQMKKACAVFSKTTNGGGKR